MAQTTQPAQRMVVTQFIVSDDVERSRRFYTEVLGGTVVFGPEPTNVALANTFIVINGGGGPTDDKPTVTLATPRDPDRVSSFLNIRVTDIHAVYDEWSARGTQFLTPPKQHPVRDPLLHPESRRLYHRGRANHRPRRRLVALRLATGQPGPATRLNSSAPPIYPPVCNPCALRVHKCSCSSGFTRLNRRGHELCQADIGHLPAPWTLTSAFWPRPSTP